MPKRIVDLTLPVHEGMPTYPRPWHSRVEITQLGRYGTEGRLTHRVTLGTHTGTHVDAPCHFLPDSSGVNSIPLKWLVGQARKIDIDLKEDPIPEKGINRHVIKKLLGKHKPARLILATGWDVHFGGLDYYEKSPWLTMGAAELLVETGVRLLGIDFPSPEQTGNGLVHKYLLGRGVCLVEYLCRLDQLKTEQFELIVMPLKLSGSIDGAPARVVAIEEA